MFNYDDVDFVLATRCWVHLLADIDEDFVAAVQGDDLGVECRWRSVNELPGFEPKVMMFDDELMVGLSESR